ncbi:MAG: amino acid ABC transporter permease [Anaerolineae bacterium]|nr:amino acid ABC transporter permease [Anaerolineae bacterium]
MEVSAPKEDKPARDDDLDVIAHESHGRAMPWAFLYTFPWWGLVLVLLTIWVVFSIAANEVYSNIFNQLQAGIAMTLRVAVSSYVLAFAIGLMIGVTRSNLPRPRYGFLGRLASLVHLVLYNVATFFVMVMRGLPILIVLLFFAFVIIPAVRNYLAANMGIQLEIRGSSPEAAIVALSFTYGAFLSETFRAGIQSIERGQIEASRSLGMNYGQTLRYIVLPQAIRRVLPPLGNDFVSMIKDSSLVAILGVNDLTQLAKVSSGASFRYLETYSTVALIYLSMTIVGSLLVRYIERRVSLDR